MRGYKASPAVQRRIEAVRRIIEKNGLHRAAQTSQALAEKIVLGCCVPAGVKACRRGRDFNRRVACVLKRAGGADITCERYPTMTTGAKGAQLRKLLPERPDWFLENKSTNQIVVGYNQLDLWGGGAQTNRAYKYLLNDNLYKELARRFNIRLVCVVGRDYGNVLANKRSKIGRALSYGVRMGRLFHLSGLIAGLGLQK